MAYGTSKQKRSNPNLKYINFRIRSKEDGKNVPVYFEVSRVNENGQNEVLKDEKPTFITGKLVGMEHDEWLFKEKNITIKNAKVYLRDGDDVQVLKVNYDGIIGRSILNALINLKTFEDVEISVYMTKGDKSYPAASVWQAGKRVEWKHSLDSLPKVKKIVTSKGTINDSGELDDFFIAEVKAFGANFGATAPVQTPAQPVSAPVTGDEVPF